MQVLSSSDGKLILKFVRQTIERELKFDKSKRPSFPPGEFPQHCGCFVTLRKGGQLRGCIGTFDSRPRLIDNLSRMAVAAAFEDPRFPPLAQPELEALRIEVSLLGEPVKMKSIEELEIGRHGIIVRHGWKSGTYLPDVATELGWSAEKFIAHCAHEKAGMSPEEAQQADIFLYEVQKIKE